LSSSQSLFDSASWEKPYEISGNVQQAFILDTLEPRSNMGLVGQLYEIQRKVKCPGVRENNKKNKRQG